MSDENFIKHNVRFDSNKSIFFPSLFIDYLYEREKEKVQTIKTGGDTA